MNFLGNIYLFGSELDFFTAPAVQIRVMWPLRDRASFKYMMSSQMLIDASILSAALTLDVELVIAEVFGHVLGSIAAASVAVLIGLLCGFCRILLKTYLWFYHFRCSAGKPMNDFLIL